MHCQVTYSQVSCSLFGCCHFFPPLWRLCFSFPTHSYLVSLPEGNASVFQQWASAPFRTSVQCYCHSQWLQVSTYSLIYQFHTSTSQTHSLKAWLWDVSQPFPHFQKECGCSACFLDVGLKRHMSFVLAEAQEHNNNAIKNARKT